MMSAASSLVCMSLICVSFMANSDAPEPSRAPVSVLGRCFVLFGENALRCKRFEGRDLAEPLAHRLGRSSAPARSGRHVGVDVAAGGDLRSHADAHVPDHPDLAAKDDKVLQRRRARNTDLAD